MSSVENTIDKTLQRTYGLAEKLIEKNKVKVNEKKDDIAEFFGIKPQDVGGLCVLRESLEGIDYKNTLFCFERFAKERGTILHERNYDEYTDARISAARMRIEVDENVWRNILNQAAVFFEWNGERYLMKISPRRFSDNQYCFSVTARNQPRLDLLLEEFNAFRKQHHYLKGKKFNGVLGEILPLNGYGWEDLVWPEGMKERLRSEIDVVFKNSALFKAYGLNSKKGFILAGEPGNGKTLLLKILAKDIQATCILVPFDEFKSTPYLFSLARDLAPTVLILEDMDLFGTDRDDAAHNVELGKLMNQLDGIIENREIIVIATTNRLEKVEKALQNRPGRFDRIYVIPNPDFRMRMSLIAHFIEKIPNEISQEHVEMLAEEFAGYSAAYLKELVNSGFAQAILRDSQNPVLRFSDMETMVGILKYKKDKVPVGFTVPEPARERSSIQNKKEEKL